MVIAGEVHGGVHGLVLEGPVTRVGVDVGGPVLQEDAEGARFGLAKPERNLVGSSHVHKSADEVKDAVEDVGAVPGSHERADSSRGRAADGVVIGVGGEVHLFGNFGDQFVDQKAGKIGADIIVLPVPGKTGELGFRLDWSKVTGINEDDGHCREFTFGDQVVEDHGDAHAVTRIAVTVEEDHVRKRLGRINFGGDIDLIVVGDAGVGFAGGEDGFREGAFSDVGLRQGVRAEVGWLGLGDRGGNGERACEEELFHDQTDSIA